MIARGGALEQGRLQAPWFCHWPLEAEVLSEVTPLCLRFPALLFNLAH